MKGDRIRAVVDTGGATQTFDIVATRAGRRLEVTTARGIVEVSEVTRGGSVVRTGRFMANRLIALVEYPALEGDGSGVEVTTRRRLGPPPADSARSRESGRETRARRGTVEREPRDQLTLTGIDAREGITAGEETAPDEALGEETAEPGGDAES